MTIVQIPCLACRVGTPAEEGAAAVSCAACGASLPAPAARAWMLLRGGSQQFGPYAFAEVARFLAEGRLQPSDEIWHEGAALRLALHRLPASTLPQGQSAPAVPAEPAAVSVAKASPTPPAQQAPAPFQPAPLAPQGPSAGARIRLHFIRSLSWNLRSLAVQPDEEARLIANGVDEADARRYLVWRRSVLLVVAWPMLVSALLATLGWATTDRSNLPDLSALGSLLEIVQLAALYALPITAWLAARAWDRHKSSRNILLRGWLVAFLTPLVLALLPFAWRYDLSNAGSAQDPTQLANMISGFGVIGAVVAYVTLMPAVLSLIPGVLRGCLRIKALIPESILPGLFLIAAAPLYILFFLVIFTTINQVAGNLVLILAVLALLMAPLLYLFNAGTFTRPLRTPEEIAKVGQVQTTAMIILSIGVGLLVVYAFTATIFGKSLVGLDHTTSLMRPWNTTLYQLPLEYFVRSLFTTVLVADLFMQMNLSLWRHSQAFAASPEAQSYDRLMTEIEEAGS
ncbi:MAG TPA: DUF4339 domain-containing protein [Allosphingosinicella sp.]|jgi:hypothetical protein|nr:DUF4339 domain-containing protein [Allosphingosinicella sp.]